MAMSELVILQPERLTDTIYELLRDRILDGRYAPGERLPVDQIARQLGVSQTPVKGALGLLVSEGLVRTSPRRGTYVTEIDERTVTESLAIRAALEQLAADTLLDHVTGADIERLRDLTGRIQTATEVGEHFRLNSEFHEVLVNLSGNQRLAEIYRQLKAHIQMALIHSRSESWTGRMASETDEHLAILAAIEANDRDALKSAIDAHLTHARASLLGQLRMQGG
jgi:DNA-binding GntR family transcriptional regulator